MFVSKNEQRSFTIDGDWIHIMPLDVRGFQMRAASFHISSVITCDISSKGAHIFKLIVLRETPRDTKRYDFEADSPKVACELHLLFRKGNALRSDNSSS
jgi:target of rapamycin complex 2 subunit MAPKAP1